MQRADEATRLLGHSSINEADQEQIISTSIRSQTELKIPVAKNDIIPKLEKAGLRYQTIESEKQSTGRSFARA